MKFKDAVGVIPLQDDREALFEGWRANAVGVEGQRLEAKTLHQCLEKIVAVRIAIGEGSREDL